jgi:putative spermidine/putrescine transport system permease protein
MNNRPSVFTTVIAISAIAFLLAPSLIVVPMSFGDGSTMSFPPERWSLDLYRQYFTQAEWADSTKTSLVVACGTTALTIALATPAAFALARSTDTWSRLARSLLVLPMLIPTIVLALGLYLYLVPVGLTGTIPGLILAHTVHVLPFAMLMIMAGIREINPSLETAVQVLGASQLVVFFKVAVPLAMRSILAASLFVFLLSFDEVVLSWLLTSPRTMTLPIKMYSSIQFEISPVLAVVSTLLFVLSLVICLVTVALLKGRQLGVAQR